jgi:uncharacterized protein with HEPN domain
MGELIDTAMLQIIRDSGEGALVLAEGLAEDELLRSRLTRTEVQRQLARMAATLGDLSPQVQGAMPEIDWAGWRATAQALAQAGAAQDEALWFALHSLVPATLLWLRVYRQPAPARP